MTVTRQLMVVSKIVPPICVGILLAMALRLYWFAYFWTDDFNNLFWVQQTNGRQLIAAIVNPTSTFFRPTGMALYWLLFRYRDLDPVSYHAVAWLLHATIVGLVYLLLRRLTHSHFAAGVGATLFAFQAILSDIYWGFGTIFEILAAFFFFLALLYHTGGKHSIAHRLVLVLLFVLAVNAKEMAITLPAVLLLTDLLQPGQGRWAVRKDVLIDSAITFGFCLAPALWSLTKNMAVMGTADPQGPYFMKFSLWTLAQGYWWYSRVLFAGRLAIPSMLATMLLFVLLLKASRRVMSFAAMYVVVTLLPVIFLVNHRFDFYWYIPFFGLALFAAVATTQVSAWMRRHTSYRTAIVSGIVLLPLFCVQHYLFQKRRAAPYRQEYELISQEHRRFVAALRALPSRALPKHLYFVTVPKHFDNEILLSAAQVALRRTDVDASPLAASRADTGLADPYWIIAP